MCQEIRDELEVNLADNDTSQGAEEEADEQEWQKVAIEMCDRRLLPTPWLSKVAPLALLFSSPHIYCLQSCLLVLSLQVVLHFCHLCLTSCSTQKLFYLDWYDEQLIMALVLSLSCWCGNLYCALHLPEQCSKD